MSARGGAGVQALDGFKASSKRYDPPRCQWPFLFAIGIRPNNSNFVSQMHVELTVVARLYCVARTEQREPGRLQT